ncbi:MAG: endonuclease/exonuclease/phosphatase family protein [Chloroflexota bacterium]
MLNILFWNINTKPLYSQIASIAHEYNVDIIALAESNLESGEVLARLNKGSSEYYYAPSSVQEYDRIQVFTKFDRRYIQSLKDASRYSIRHLNIPNKPDILVVMVHLQSKLHADENNQQLGAQNLIGAVQEAEEKVGHDRTILLGDFNMNPFESGLVNATGLHAVMSRGRAEKSHRSIDGQSYKFFYNPMWRLMGDETQLTPGTYHYVSSSVQEYFWHTFDQFLVRPPLMEFLPSNQPQIISNIGNESLLNANGIPNKNSASDHLPVFASLKF